MLVVITSNPVLQPQHDRGSGYGGSGYGGRDSSDEAREKGRSQVMKGLSCYAKALVFIMLALMNFEDWTDMHIRDSLLVSLLLTEVEA